MGDLLPEKTGLPVRRTVTSMTAIHLVDQAELFDDLDVGRELLSIEEDMTRPHNEHTARALEKRVELRDAILERLVDGMSQREVARIFRVSRNNVAKLVQKMEAAGKMEPYKKRMAEKYGRVIELGTEMILEKLEKDLVPVNVIPVMVGIFADKKALLEGEPTAILGAAKQGLNVEAFDRFIEELPRVKEVEVSVTPIDSQSTDNTTKGQ